jgi:hypothetical protein
MTHYVLSPRPQNDMGSIWDYTAERWSDEQAERYARALQEAIETIAATRVVRGLAITFVPATANTPLAHTSYSSAQPRTE